MTNQQPPSQLRTEIAELCDAWDRCGVTLDAFEQPPGTLCVSWIERSSRAAPGSGRAALRDLCEIADRYGCRVELAALKGSTALVCLYVAEGFDRTETHPETKDVSMVRLPRAERT